MSETRHHEPPTGLMYKLRTATGKPLQTEDTDLALDQARVLAAEFSRIHRAPRGQVFAVSQRYREPFATTPAVWAEHYARGVLVSTGRYVAGLYPHAWDWDQPTSERTEPAHARHR
jgi:hypothetical protein